MADAGHRFATNGAGFLPGSAAFGEPDKVLRRVVEDFENQMRHAMEQLVAGDGFGELMASFTANTVALTRLGAELMDLTWRNLRVAGRTDVDRLARQLARTEDKLELVLQAVERLADAREHG